MVEPTASWATAGKDVLNVVIRGMPQRFLRWRWPVQKLLDAIQVLPEAQPSRFYIGEDRSSHDFEQMQFHIFNLSPLQLSLVGAEIEVMLNSKTFLRSDDRFPVQSDLKPFSRGGFPFRKALSEQQSQTLQREKGDLVFIRITGNVIVKSPFGEHRKNLHADVVASIGR